MSLVSNISIFTLPYSCYAIISDNSPSSGIITERRTSPTKIERTITIVGSKIDVGNRVCGFLFILLSQFFHYFVRCTSLKTKGDQTKLHSLKKSGFRDGFCKSISFRELLLNGSKLFPDLSLGNHSPCQLHTKLRGKSASDSQGNTLAKTTVIQIYRNFLPGKRQTILRISSCPFG